MKRIVAIILSVLLMLSLTACKHGGSGEDGYSVDISYYLSAGQIKEAQFMLGASLESINKEMSKHTADEHSGDGHDDAIVFVEDYEYSFYSTAEFDYYYRNDKADKGISCIVGNADIYGFSVGQSGLYEVKSALELEKLNPVEGKAKSNEFFFLMVSLDDCKKLTCVKDNKELVFYFENDILIAGVLYNTDNWTI